MTIKERANELLERSFSRNIFTYTDFLTSAEQAEVLSAVNENTVGFFGGCDFAERKKACFGREKDLGYPPDYSIRILKISPSGIKFAEDITHRDVLGATLNLGVERDKVGDIFAVGKEAYIIADEKISPLILSELKRVGRNPVEVTEVDCVPETFRPEREEKRVSVAAIRADAIVGGAFNLSREESSSLFRKSCVSVNGKEFPDGSKKLKYGDTVSVRGHGKFAFIRDDGESRKGKTFVVLEIYR